MACQENLSFDMPSGRCLVALASESLSVDALVVDALQLTDRRQPPIGITGQSKFNAVCRSLTPVHVAAEVVLARPHERRGWIHPVPAHACVRRRLMPLSRGG